MFVQCPRCGGEHELPIKKVLANNAEVTIKCALGNVTVKVKVYASTDFEEREGSSKKKVKTDEWK